MGSILPPDPFFNTVFRRPSDRTVEMVAGPFDGLIVTAPVIDNVVTFKGDGELADPDTGELGVYVYRQREGQKRYFDYQPPIPA